MFPKCIRRAGLNVGASATVLGLLLCLSSPAWADERGEIEALRQQLEQLKAEQSSTAARIGQLESALAAASTRTAPAASMTSSAPPALASSTPAASVNPAGASAPGAAPLPMPSRLAINGDFRVRYESNFSDRDTRNRDRGVLRARLRAAYAVNDWLTVGGQLATGDPDDPNSTDITLSNFDDDLQVSLDQAYARLTFGNLQLFAGKIPQPFVRTELVWDGDVSPQGLSASYRLPVGKGSLKFNSLYFLVDESVAGPNSDMLGGQLAFDQAVSDRLKLELAVGYYDYRLKSLAGGDSGDFRSNLFAAGRYLSDFNILDAIGAINISGLGARWPVRLVGEYAKNFGAVAGDTALEFDALVGRLSKKGDWRFGYGYSQAGVDAVFAAFSHDNTNIATNYVQHSLSVDHALADNVLLNATLYHYRPKSPLYAGANDPRDWLDRLRLNFLVNF